MLLVQLVGHSMVSLQTVNCVLSKYLVLMGLDHILVLLLGSTMLYPNAVFLDPLSVLPT
jgi:hypothetical protein